MGRWRDHAARNAWRTPIAEVAEKTNPELWEAVKAEVTASDKGGKPGQWSARKAQRAVRLYEERGGGFKGRKIVDNHLVQWEREAWGTKSGGESLKTGERYLPKAARDALTPEEYRRTTAKKRADLKAGRQVSRQPKSIAEKAARHRGVDGSGSGTKANLLRQARERGIPGRSRMSKAELEQALS
jgi:hypothetical protein